MFRTSVLMLSATLLFSYMVAGAAPAGLYPLRNEDLKVVGQADPKHYFSVQMPKWPSTLKIDTDPVKLADVARQTLQYLENMAIQDPQAVTPGLLGGMGVTLADITNTLKFLTKVVAEDQAKGNPSRLHNTQFLQSHFRFFKWSADQAQAKAHNVKMIGPPLRITKYAVFEANGSLTKTAQNNCALYALPDEEAQLSGKVAEQKKNTLIRYRYNKQQIVAGALDKLTGIRPLVWLNRQGLEDALMQGTVAVNLPGSKQRLFNVHRNNGILYDRKLKDPRQQKRYWYFMEVPGPRGYGKDMENKIVVQPGVTFAGDVYNVGLGKLIAIQYQLSAGPPRLKLGVLADTGGAFIPNLYQLDFLAGIFPNREAFGKAVAQLPEYAQTSILIVNPH